MKSRSVTSVGGASTRTGRPFSRNSISREAVVVTLSFYHWRRDVAATNFAGGCKVECVEICR
jgi:hypothetical protein